MYPIVNIILGYMHRAVDVQCCTITLIGGLKIRGDNSHVLSVVTYGNFMITVNVIHCMSQSNCPTSYLLNLYDRLIAYLTAKYEIYNTSIFLEAS